MVSARVRKRRVGGSGSAEAFGKPQRTSLEKGNGSAEAFGKPAQTRGQRENQFDKRRARLKSEVRLRPMPDHDKLEQTHKFIILVSMRSSIGKDLTVIDLPGFE